MLNPEGHTFGFRFHYYLKNALFNKNVYNLQISKIIYRIFMFIKYYIRSWCYGKPRSHIWAFMLIIINKWKIKCVI